MQKKDFILASASPHRLALLEQIEMPPKMVLPADIDETTKKDEAPTAYVKRMAVEKARKIASIHKGENILACDTIVVVGTRVLHKSTTDAEQEKVMRLISGRSSHAISAVCLISKDGKESLRCVDTRVITKSLSEEEIKRYVKSHEWMGCCGYKIDGTFAGMVRKIIGSYTGVVGLPLCETLCLLNGVGIK